MELYHKFKETLVARKLWEPFTYLFFGGLTTLVNIVAYFVTKQLLPTNVIFGQEMVANAISWVVAVIFAFVTNKIWVFCSKTENFQELCREFGLFVFYRGISFILDMAMFYCLIHFVMMNDFGAKLITQVFVIVANYFFSKLFIFNNNKTK